MGYITFILCITTIAVLFALDSHKDCRSSKALWIPVAWLWVIGSRPVSDWLGSGSGPIGSGPALDATLEGNSTDAFFYLLLLAAGIVVVCLRKRKARIFLRVSGPI